MLRLFGSQRRLCSGLTRRDWMHVGGLGMLGVSLAEAERLKALAEGEARPDGVGFGAAKSCILLLPYGSPPQHETFDPKPLAPKEVRGVHQPIGSTSQTLLNLAGDFTDRHSNLLERIAITYGHGHVGGRVAVDRDAPRRADFVLLAVAAADRALL